MKLTCPVCMSKFAPECLDAAAEFSELIELAARLGSVWALANEYLQAFRLVQGGAITIKMRLRRLREITDFWETGNFEFGGRRYRTDRTQIKNAMLTVCNAQKVGFSNHNYLKRILLNGAEQVSAEGLTARDEQEREDALRRRGTQSNGQKSEKTTLTEFEQRTGQNVFSKLAKTMEGKKI